MTQEEIANMPAGREMDALIAKLYFGWEKGKQWDGPLFWEVLRHPTDGSILPDDYPHYSTDWGAAGLVVNELKQHDIFFVMVVADDICMAGFSHYRVPVDYEKLIEASSLPLAVCRAALIASMEEKA